MPLLEIALEIQKSPIFSPRAKELLQQHCGDLDEISGWEMPRRSKAAFFQENARLMSAVQTHFTSVCRREQTPDARRAAHDEDSARRREGREDESGNDRERTRRGSETEGDINSDQLNNEGVLMALPNYNQACH